MCFDFLTVFFLKLKLETGTVAHEIYSKHDWFLIERSVNSNEKVLSTIYGFLVFEIILV